MNQIAEKIKQFNEKASQKTSGNSEKHVQKRMKIIARLINKQKTESRFKESVEEKGNNPENEDSEVEGENDISDDNGNNY